MIFKKKDGYVGVTYLFVTPYGLRLQKFQHSKSGSVSNGIVKEGQRSLGHVIITRNYVVGNEENGYSRRPKRR